MTEIITFTATTLISVMIGACGTYFFDRIRDDRLRERQRADRIEVFQQDTLIELQDRLSEYSEIVRQAIVNKSITVRGTDNWPVGLVHDDPVVVRFMPTRDRIEILAMRTRDDELITSVKQAIAVVDNAVRAQESKTAWEAVRQAVDMLHTASNRTGALLEVYYR